MKEKILDFRTFITVILVLISLMGQNMIEIPTGKADTQNLNFIDQTDEENNGC
ncbi:MAG: hypothetical protein H7X99_01405 [Saprospiraceae bacterium]|nr:hypothetical protein [Saprospiraceae bacterium]